MSEVRTRRDEHRERPGDEDEHGEEAERRKRDVAERVGFDACREQDEQHRDQQRAQALVELEHLADRRGVAAGEVDADHGDREQPGLLLDLVGRDEAGDDERERHRHRELVGDQEPSQRRVEDERGPEAEADAGDEREPDDAEQTQRRLRWFRRRGRSRTRPARPWRRSDRSARPRRAGSGRWCRPGGRTAAAGRRRSVR